MQRRATLCNVFSMRLSLYFFAGPGGLGEGFFLPPPSAQEAVCVQ